MKKSYSIAAACMLSLFSFTMAAQEFRHGFSWGIKNGANRSSLITESKIMHDDDRIAARWGYVGGVFADYRFSRKFMLSCDALFSCKGFKADIVPGITDAVFRLNYLDLPVMANFYIYKGLALKVGLQPSVLLSATAKGRLKKQTVAAQTVHASIRRYDCAIPVGISYDFKDRFTLDIRYAIGGYGILRELPVDDLNNNTTLTVTIGFRM
ncbi:MAG TPA: PorT family protein [Candidatus Tidjanibacter gallistercoris]|nr:PorT family protein [Candidatus Tidjanibacter gallistercoris]